tara:strand:+ start:117 stop:392 length:276 start_codon:yes stop_codon:yes gene_type:complete
MQKEDMKHYMLIFCTLKLLPQKEKVRVLRELQGYKEKKHGKEYAHKGLVQKLNSQKLGSNVILVPINNYTEFQNFFSKNNVNTEVKEAWLK